MWFPLSHFRDNYSINKLNKIGARNEKDLDKFIGTQIEILTNENSEEIQNRQEWDRFTVNNGRFRNVLRYRLECELSKKRKRKEIRKLLSWEKQIFSEITRLLTPIRPNSNSKIFWGLGLNRGSSLQLAINNGLRFKKLAAKILDETDIDDLKHVSVIETDDQYGNIISVISTPLRDLIKVHPDLAKKALDKCFKMEDNNNILARYDILDDRKLIAKKPFPFAEGSLENDRLKQSTYDLIASRLERKIDCDYPLKLMLINKTADLLRHPLVSLFVEGNWKKTRSFHHRQFIFFACFLVCWVLFGVGETALRHDYLNSNSTKSGLDFPNAPALKKMPTWTGYLFYPTLALSIFGLLLMTGKLFLCFLKIMAMRLHMISELTCYSCVIHYCSTILKNDGGGSVATGVFGMLFAWITLMFYCEILPGIGAHIKLFFAIVLRYSKYLTVGVLLLCGFTSTFIILFHTVTKFESIHSAFVSTGQIILSQFSTDQLLTEVAGENYAPMNLENARYLLTVFVLSFCFLLFGFLAYMNMLIALASDDTKTLLEYAELTFFMEKASMVAGRHHFKQSYFYHTVKKWLKIIRKLDLTEYFLNTIYLFDLWQWSDKRRWNGYMDAAKKIVLSRRQNIVKQIVTQEMATQAPPGWTRTPPPTPAVAWTQSGHERETSIVPVLEILPNRII